MYANGAYESFWFPLPIIRTSGCNVLFSVGTSGGITYQILPLLFVINCHVKWKSPIPKGKSFNCSECSTFPWIVEVQLLSRRKPWFFSSDPERSAGTKKGPGVGGPAVIKTSLAPQGTAVYAEFSTYAWETNSFRSFYHYQVAAIVLGKIASGLYSIH